MKLFVLALPLVALLVIPTHADEPISTRVIPVESNMHRFMEYMFQPSYKRLRSALQKEPVDKKKWSAIKADALVLAEACNLVINRVPSKHKAAANDWNAISAASREAGKALYASAAKRDFKSAVPQFKMMLQKCNTCHKQFHNNKPILMP